MLDCFGHPSYRGVDCCRLQTTNRFRCKRTRERSLDRPMTCGVRTESKNEKGRLWRPLASKSHSAKSFISGENPCK
jgi:hypothetical protein